MDMDTYSKNIYAMNDSLHDLHRNGFDYSDIQRLAQQQSQIQQMMHTSQSAIPSASPQRPPPPPQHQANPMDPQPFYISQPDPPPQRRTWGQPQPISFAHQGPGGGVEWPPQQPPRRAQWGAPQPPQQRPPMMFDPYSGAPIDQWGNPVPPQYHNGYYQQPSPYSGYSNPTYGGPGGPGGQNPQGAPPGGAGYNQYGGANPYPASSSTPRTPFRLHEGQGTNSPSPAGPPGGSPGMQGVGGNPVVKPHSAPAPSRASTSTLPRRLS